jgi:hypothetical protein
MPLRGRKRPREGAGSLPATRQERFVEGAAGGKEEDGISLSMKRLVVIALVALLVALAVLLVPSHSWAAVLEWFMNPPQSSPCGCILQSGVNG